MCSLLHHRGVRAYLVVREALNFLGFLAQAVDPAYETVSVVRLPWRGVRWAAAWSENDAMTRLHARVAVLPVPGKALVLDDHPGQRGHGVLRGSTVMEARLMGAGGG